MTQLGLLQKKLLLILLYIFHSTYKYCLIQHFSIYLLIYLIISPIRMSASTELGLCLIFPIQMCLHRSHSVNTGWVNEWKEWINDEGIKNAGFLHPHRVPFPPRCPIGNGESLTGSLLRAAALQTAPGVYAWASMSVFSLRHSSVIHTLANFAFHLPSTLVFNFQC